VYRPFAGRDRGQTADVVPSSGEIRFGTPPGRWVIAATVLGSGIAFLDGTIVNVALPAIGRALKTDVAGLQWTVDAYLVLLTALLLFGGALGDRFGRRRVFVSGLVSFTVASVACAVAPDATALAVARAVQGAAGALLVPGSLAIIGSAFHDSDRGRAIGAWSGLAGIASAIGPFVGGWLIDTFSWRWVFLINVPIAVAAVAITVRHVPESRADTQQPLDIGGAILAAVGLATLCWTLIESAHGFGASEMATAVLGVASIAAFLALERRSAHPMLPLRLFRSRPFSGTNGTTIAVYAALGGAMFMVVLELQLALGYSALAAGASLAPMTVLMFLLSSRAGALAQRIGARIPMTIGPLLIAGGLLLFTAIAPGRSYLTAVLPAVIVFGLGLSCTVAPLTATVLASVDDAELGVASGVNNAAARLAGLLAVAVLPTLVHLDTTLPAAVLTGRVAVALRICAVLAVIGSAISWLTVGARPVTRPARPADLLIPCYDPCVADDASAA
jgi:EmrB/QacA subfamily drug resistance transporter